MRVLISILLLILLSACNTPEKTATPEPEIPAISKIGIVGLVQQQRTRAVDDSNWKTAILGIIRNSESDKNTNVVKIVYEVTVFYDAGEQELIRVDQDPQVRPGQRVRVTGNKIEALPR